MDETALPEAEKKRIAEAQHSLLRTEIYNTISILTVLTKVSGMHIGTPPDAALEHDLDELALSECRHLVDLRKRERALAAELGQP